MSSITNPKSHQRPFMGTKLHPRQGVWAGMFAGLGLLAIWWAFANLTDASINTILGSIGNGFHLDGASSPALIAGLSIHLLVAIILGALYAAAMDRLDVKDTFIVSAFYGFAIWIVSGIILRAWPQRAITTFIQSWWGLGSLLIFGLLLGVYANLFGDASN